MWKKGVPLHLELLCARARTCDIYVKQACIVILLLFSALMVMMAAAGVKSAPMAEETADTLSHEAALPADTLLHEAALPADSDDERMKPMFPEMWDALDSVAAAVADTLLPDTLAADTLAADTVKKKSKSALDEPVVYSAQDSITFDYKNSRAWLYGDSKVNYQNMELTAEEINMALDSSTVHAFGRPDSTGEIQGKPVFKQGEDEYDPDKMSYNFKTRRGFIHNVYTQQGEGYMMSEESKRDSTGVMYVRRARYTTCNAEHPHFYLRLTKAKVRPGQTVVFGPAYLVVEDVPLPLAIPYGFFPFSSSYHSGFIMPTYGDESSRGFYLREGGYYFAFNDNVDLKLLGEIYTKGSWGLSAYSTYNVRYKFAGNVMFSFQNTVVGERNMPDYSTTRSLKFVWSHRQDAKANPTQSFSASVNFASVDYERNNLVSMYNPESYTQSTRTSSVSYSKIFPDIGLTISTAFNLSQNMRDSSIAVTLPTLSISLSRLYPFKRKKQVGAEKWYEKISLSYTGTLSNSITTKENKLFHSNLLKDWRNGMQHQIPIQATFQLFKYINVTPSFNFTDRMYTNKVMQSWDSDEQTVKRDTLYGFYNVYNFSMNLSMNTKLYGFYRPTLGFMRKKIEAVRHVFTPTVSFSYAPDFSTPFWGMYETYTRTNSSGEVETVTYSPYSGGIYGTAPSGKTGMVTMDVSNNLEMKIRSDRDSTGFRKISLIDELGASLSYNMAAEKRPWSDLTTRLRLKLTKSYTFSMTAVFATYAYELDKNGNPYVGDQTEWSKGRFGRFQGMSQNISYTFNNGTLKKLINFFTGKKEDPDALAKKEAEEQDQPDPNNPNVDPERERAKHGAKPKEGDDQIDADGYLKFNIPWSLSVSYGITVRENTAGTFDKESMRYPYALSHTLNFSGNVRIATGWNITFSSGYDFNRSKLSMTTASLNRDLHCFNMSASVVLYPYTSYNFTFQANSSMLADALKWKKQSSYSDNISWY